MRTTRAVKAGLGTTGTMVAAMACLFFMASTLIAFNSWTNSSISDRIESLFVGDKNPSAAVEAPGPQVSASASASAIAALVARAPSLARAGTSSAGAGRGDRASDVGSSTPRDESTVVPVVGGDGSGSLVNRPDPGSSPAPKIGGSDAEVAPVPPDHAATLSLGGVVQNTTDTLAGTVEQTTGQLGSSLGGVSQPLGDVVTSTGQTLGGTIAYTGQTLGGILDGNR